MNLVHSLPDGPLDLIGDVHGEIDVPDHVAVLGGEVTAPTPSGRRISLQIAPGSRPGKVIRIRDKGVPGLAGSPAGDLLFHLRVTVPENPSAEQRQLYEKLKELDPKKA